MIHPKLFLIATAITLASIYSRVDCFPLNITSDEAEKQLLPSFEWDVDKDTPPFKLTIEFHDGNDPDIAILFPRVYDGVEEPCILRGTLTNEPNVDVSVNGCPSDDNFNVVMRSARYPGGLFLVKNGITKEIGHHPNFSDIVIPAQYEVAEDSAEEKDSDENKDEVESTETEGLEDEAALNEDEAQPQLNDETKNESVEKEDNVKYQEVKAVESKSDEIEDESSEENNENESIEDDSEVPKDLSDDANKDKDESGDEVLPDEVDESIEELENESESDESEESEEDDDESEMTENEGDAESVTGENKTEVKREGSVKNVTGENGNEVETEGSGGGEETMGEA